jgi:hypothetical protein
VLLTVRQFPVVRFRVSCMVRRVGFTPTGMRGNHHFRKHKFGHHHNTLEDKKMMIQSFTEELQQEYFEDMDESVPINWLCVLVAKLVISKMYLVSGYEYLSCADCTDDVSRRTTKGWWKVSSSGCAR